MQSRTGSRSRDAVLYSTSIICHEQGVVNRDIKLENTLLDGSKRPLLKICDFGYSKNDKDSVPKSKVGTPGYTGAAPQQALTFAAGCP